MGQDSRVEAEIHVIRSAGRPRRHMQTQAIIGKRRFNRGADDGTGFRDQPPVAVSSVGGLRPDPELGPDEAIAEHNFVSFNPPAAPRGAF